MLLNRDDSSMTENSDTHSQSIDNFLRWLQQEREIEDSDVIRKAFITLIGHRGNPKVVTGKTLVEDTIDICKIAVDEIGLGFTSVISIILHKSQECAEELKIDIEELYGPGIKLITEGLCKISEVGEQTISSQAENFRRLLINLAKDVRVILIKLAEQLQLMRHLKSLPESKRISIAHEAAFLYAPLAHRLGLYIVKSEMEDLSLKFTDRKTYDLIAKKLAETMRARKKFIHDFVTPIDKELKKQGFKFEIKGRPKSIHSIWSKMKRKGIDFEDIYDLFAIRIIIQSESKNEKADCWQVYSTVTDIFQPNPLRLRDWISVPKTNGYESLHTTVIGPGGRWVEVQIRTERMNEIAEKGFAAHWKYKGLESDQGLEEWLAKIREIIETPEPDAADFIDDFKLSLYSKEIFVFTPKGDLRKFPSGATVLDFAYDIHSDVGAMCIGAKINGKAVPIRYKLQNGDKVEIQTSKTQLPKLDWLNFVVTSKAKNKIRQRLNEEKAKEAEHGKELIKRRFKNWKIDYNDDSIRKILKYYKFNNSQDFYYQVSLEKIDLNEIKDILTSENEEDKTKQITDVETKSSFEIIDSQIDDFLVIDEQVADVDYRLARCCSPIPGDKIFGFVTINEGIKIHRSNCPNATQLIGKYGYRVVNAKWTRKDAETVFPVDIGISGEDNTNILNNVYEIITKDLHVNIRSIKLDTTDGVFEGKISLTVRNLKHLDYLIGRIRNIKGVYHVGRVEK